MSTERYLQATSRADLRGDYMVEFIFHSNGEVLVEDVKRDNHGGLVRSREILSEERALEELKELGGTLRADLKPIEGAPNPHSKFGYGRSE